MLTLIHFIQKGVSASLPLLLANTKKLYNTIVWQNIEFSCRNLSSHIFCGCINLTAGIHWKFLLLLQVQNSEISARQQSTQLQWSNNTYQAEFQNFIQNYSSNLTFFKCHKTSILQYLYSFLPFIPPELLLLTVTRTGSEVLAEATHISSN